MFDVRVMPNPSSMILQLLATIVLYFILKHFLYKPVSKFMNERKQKIQDNMDNAKTLKGEAIDLKNQYELKIRDAKKEGQEIVESSRRRGEQIKQGIVNDAQKEASNIIYRAKKEIEREKEKALEEIKGQVGDMAVLLASKVVEQKLDVNMQEELVDKFIDEVGRSKWQN